MSTPKPSTKNIFIVIIWLCCNKLLKGIYLTNIYKLVKELHYSIVLNTFLNARLVAFAVILLALVCNEQLKTFLTNKGCKCA